MPVGTSAQPQFDGVCQPFEKIELLHITGEAEILEFAAQPPIGGVFAVLLVAIYFGLSHLMRMDERLALCDENDVRHVAAQRQLHGLQSRPDRTKYW